MLGLAPTSRLSSVMSSLRLSRLQWRGASRPGRNCRKHSAPRMQLGLMLTSWRSLPGRLQHLAEFTMPCVGWGATFLWTWTSRCWCFQQSRKVVAMGAQTGPSGAPTDHSLFGWLGLHGGGLIAMECSTLSLDDGVWSGEIWPRTTIQPGLLECHCDGVLLPEG